MYFLFFKTAFFKAVWIHSKMKRKVQRFRLPRTPHVHSPHGSIPLRRGVSYRDPHWYLTTGSVSAAGLLLGVPCGLDRCAVTASLGSQRGPHRTPCLLHLCAIPPHSLCPVDGLAAHCQRLHEVQCVCFFDACAFDGCPPEVTTGPGS